MALILDLDDVTLVGEKIVDPSMMKGFQNGLLGGNVYVLNLALVDLHNLVVVLHKVNDPLLVYHLLQLA